MRREEGGVRSYLALGPVLLGRECGWGEFGFPPPKPTHHKNNKKGGCGPLLVFPREREDDTPSLPLGPIPPVRGKCPEGAKGVGKVPRRGG